MSRKKSEYVGHYYHCSDSSRTDCSSVFECILGRRNASVFMGLSHLSKSVRYSVSAQLHMDVRVTGGNNYLSFILLPGCIFSRPLDFFNSLAPKSAPESHISTSQSDDLWWVFLSCNHFGSANNSQLLHFSVYVNLEIHWT